MEKLKIAKSLNYGENFANMVKIGLFLFSLPLLPLLIRALPLLLFGCNTQSVEEPSFHVSQPISSPYPITLISQLKVHTYMKQKHYFHIALHTC